MSVYEIAIAVAESDIDAQRHVNNVSYLRFIQDAAIAHWRALAPPDVQARLNWVVRRHEVDYLKPANPGEEIRARTWVGEPSGATWERFTEVVRAADGVVLVKARTVWVAIDAETLRPRRVDPGLVERFRTAG